MELSENKKEAVKLVNENNVTIITGGPGTGKTTIIKTILIFMKEKGKKGSSLCTNRKSCQNE